MEIPMGFNTKNENGLKTTWGECGCSKLRCIHWDNWSLDSMPRVTITPNHTAKEKAHFERYNAVAESAELLWIELEIQAMEQEERGRKTSTSKAKKRTEESNEDWIGDAIDHVGLIEPVRYDDEYDDDTHR
jgi:hypothetical protein